MPADTSEESCDNSVESTSKKPKEKRVLIRGSIPTIYCANKAPEKLEPSDRERRAVSVKSSCVFNFHNKLLSLLVSALFKDRNIENVEIFDKLRRITIKLFRITFYFCKSSTTALERCDNARKLQARIIGLSLVAINYSTLHFNAYCVGVN